MNKEEEKNSEVSPETVPETKTEAKPASETVVSEEGFVIDATKTSSAGEEKPSETHSSPESVAAELPDVDSEKPALNWTYIGAAVLVLAIIGAGLWWFLAGGKEMNPLRVRGGEQPALLAESLVASSREYPEVVATVNGAEITSQELVQGLISVEARLRQQGIDLSATATQALVEDQAITTLVNRELVSQAAAEIGVVATPDQIQAELQRLADQFGGEEVLAAEMTALGITDADLLADITEQLTVNQYLETVILVEDVAVSDAEIQVFYDEVVAAGQQLPPVDTISSEIAQRLVQEKQNELIDEAVQALRAEAAIEIMI